MFTTAKIVVGDNREMLRTLENGSVQTCITSPPYWGLRDYGTATWVGGLDDCDHLGKPMATRANINRNMGGKDVKNAEYREPMGWVCTNCGALREDDQIGLEESPEDFVEQLCLVFDEVWRVLADDGTLWLNLGDSYAGNNSRASNNGRAGFGNEREGVFTKTGDGLKTKDLVGIPWRVAFALQARGWYLRSEIIWHKPNPMPESVTDRPTKSHEHIFLMSKSPKYFYDHEAIKEPVTEASLNRAKYAFNSDRPSTKNNSLGDKGGIHVEQMGERFVDPNGRNKRDVWTIPTQGFPGAHFAVYPPALIEPCVLAGSREGDTVLDPFSGSGTTGMVALRHGRNYVGIELNPEYAELSRERIVQDCGMFGEVEIVNG